MKKKEEEIIWSRSNGSLFEKFALSLEDYTRTGKAPAEGDQDLQYGLELQNKRLQKKGLSMLYKCVPAGWKEVCTKDLKRNMKIRKI